MFDKTPVHWAGDALSISTLIAWLAGALPAIATLASLVYFALQIYHDQSVQEGIQNWLNRRREKRLAKLIAGQAVAQAAIAALELARHQAAQAAAVVETAKVTAASLVATTAIPPAPQRGQEPSK